MSERKYLLILMMLVFVSGISACLSDEKPGGSDIGAVPRNDGGNAPNNAPTISGSPDTAILTGDVYSFTPSANDADGDTLSFSITNLPRWATFDSTTGRLSGQTLLGDAGTYSGIRISVSDDTSTSSLRTFSITVAQSASGSMTLDWSAPTENTDGTSLVDLAGFKLYYGSSPGNYPNEIQIDNPSINTYVIENLLPDTYYVVATSFNSQSVESEYSGVAVKIVTIN